MSQRNRTNVHLLERFTEELIRYEMTVTPNSNNYEDYRQPAETMKQALLKIVHADESDTLSLMRIMAKHIQIGIEDTYSDYTLMMLTADLRDSQARTLILNVLYTTRCLIAGKRVDLDESWLALVNNNMTIFHFLQNYENSDLKLIEESYSGNVIRPVRETLKIPFTDTFVNLEIGYANYEVFLKAHEPQTVSFSVSPAIKPDPDADSSKPLIIETEVILCPQMGQLILDKSIRFSDDAKAQMRALDCAPGGYHHGEDTLITLPGIFYSACLVIVSSDSGESWRIADIQVLPPSLDHHLE